MDTYEQTLKELMNLKVSDLGAHLPTQTIVFDSLSDVMTMTEDQAMLVLRSARRYLLHDLLHQEVSEGMLDDSGDDLTAATDNWAAIHGAYF